MGFSYNTMPENPPATQQSDTSRRHAEPEAIAVRVVYEDEDLFVIDKPPGMVVHPTYRNWSGTLLNALLWLVRDRPDARPSIVTRLDKDTSGLVVVALSPEIHARVQRNAAAGRMKKEYLAIVRGIPEPASGVLSMPLARSIEDRRRVVITPSGQISHTHYEVVSSLRGVALVKCELITGRTHQIRVHLAGRGWPILGDPTYGVPHPALPRQALHAWRVSLPHPVSQTPLQFDVPLPADLRDVVAEFS